ncbi:hypothetical protein GCM10027612_28070 [Microbispora bryophytorum subsp. camponoti]
MAERAQVAQRLLQCDRVVAGDAGKVPVIGGRVDQHGGQPPLDQPQVMPVDDAGLGVEPPAKTTPDTCCCNNRST